MPPAPAPVLSPPVNPYASVRPVEGKAIAALVLGLFSPVAALYYGFPGLILGTIAVVLGIQARRRVRKSGGVLGGGGIALAGWIAGICGMVVGLVWGLFLLSLWLAMTGTGVGDGAKG